MIFFELIIVYTTKYGSRYIFSISICNHFITICWKGCLSPLFSLCMFVWQFSQLDGKVDRHRCPDHKAAFPRVKANHCINQHTWEFHSLSASRALLKTDMLELFKLPLYNVQGIISITPSLLPTEMLENFRRQLFLWIFWIFFHLQICFWILIATSSLIYWITIAQG